MGFQEKIDLSPEEKAKAYVRAVHEAVAHRKIVPASPGSLWLACLRIAATLDAEGAPYAPCLAAVAEDCRKNGWTQTAEILPCGITRRPTRFFKESCAAQLRQLPYL